MVLHSKTQVITAVTHTVGLSIQHFSIHWVCSGDIDLILIKSMN